MTGSRSVVTPTRKFARLGALLVVGSVGLAACGGGHHPSVASIAGRRRGTIEYSLAQAQSALVPGASRFVFGLISPDGAQVDATTAQVWVAKSENDRAQGPFTAHWQTWTAQHADATGAAPVPGFYVVDVTVPTPGNWYILATAENNGRTISGTAAMPVRTDGPARLGTKAVAEATPVASTPEQARAIDTRDPPTPMHYISLDDALRNGLPTVVVFATPLLCQSRMCGPVVDEALSVYDKVTPNRANFVDVEIYPDRDPNRPAQAFLRWGFESEPWVLVIDSDGTIRGRFEGPVAAPEIARALEPLLRAT